MTLENALTNANTHALVVEHISVGTFDQGEKEEVEKNEERATGPSV